MRKMVYYVASSLDGYIAGPNNDISRFVASGEGVQHYLNDLLVFDTTIMGRKTYEFGYDYGLIPGQPAYPHMQHYILSSSLQFEQTHEKVAVHPLDEAFIQKLKAEAGSDIYLCGGGQLAGWLLDRNLVDTVKLKLNPIVLGAGIRLFGDSTTAASFQLEEQLHFEDGLQILTYKVLKEE